MKNSLLFTFLLLFVAFTGVNGQGTVNFDDDAKWTADPNVSSASSYSSLHTYTDGVFSAAGGDALRQGTAVQDGYPGAFGIYSWRLRNVETVEWMITISSGGVKDFGMKIRRWDASPSPNFDLSYSIDGGTNWTNVSTINNASLSESSDWKVFAGSINSTVDNIKIRLKANGTTERIMIDDFYWTVEGSTLGTLELTSPNGGESYTAGQTAQFAWNSTDVANVYFEVWTEELKWEQITGLITSYDGANTHDFSIPANAWTWDGYKIRVVDASNPDVKDESDGTFSLAGHDTELYWEGFENSAFTASLQYSVLGSAKMWTAYNGYAEMNGYDNAAQEIEEDWLITTGVNLDNTKDEILNFYTSVSYDKAGSDLALFYSVDYAGSGDPSGSTWVPLTATFATSTAYTHSGYIDLSSLTGTVYFAFKYTSTATDADKWQVANIFISGVDDSSTRIDIDNEKTVKVSPNPFTTELKVEGDNIVGAALYNVAGQLVKDMPYMGGTISTTDLNKGMYILQVKLADGAVTTQKVIKK